MKVTSILKNALGQRYGETGRRVAQRVEEQAVEEMRPAVDLLRERMAFTDILQQALLEEVLEQPGGVEALNRSYLLEQLRLDRDEFLSLPDAARNALVVRAMDNIVRTLASTLAPYETPKLSMSANMNAEVDLRDLSDEELEAQYRKELEREARRLVEQRSEVAEKVLVNGVEVER